MSLGRLVALKFSPRCAIRKRWNVSGAKRASLPR
jgi:hypothetical protein